MEKIGELKYIMEDWKECTIGDICSSVSETYSRKDENVVLINTSDVLEGKFLTHLEVPNKDLKGQFKKTFQRNDILYSEIRPANKRYAYVDFDKTANYIASTKLMVIRPNMTLVDPKYLFALLTSNELIEEMQHLAETRSGTFPQITFSSELSTYPVTLPPLPTQQKIAQILSSLDDKIELNNKINANLEQQAQALFKSWFVDFEPFGGEMPAGWKEGKLGEFVEIKRGGSPRPIQNFMADEGLRWLKISDVTSLSAPFVLKIAEHIKEEGLSKTVFLKAGSLVLSNSATPGIPKIIDLDTCIHDGWLYFPKSQLSYEYLYLLFKEIRPKLVSLGNGSIFTNLKTDILKNYEICLPPSDILNQFQSIIHPMFEKMLCTQREIKQIETIRDTLLPKLMNGEISL